MKRGRIADSVKLVHELQLDALADVVGVGVGGAQLVLAADGPDQRGVPLDECIRRLLVARVTRSVTGGRYAPGQRRIGWAHRAGAGGGDEGDLPAGRTVGDHRVGWAGSGGCGS